MLRHHRFVLAQEYKFIGIPRLRLHIAHAQQFLPQACDAVIVQQTKKRFAEAVCFLAAQARTRKHGKGVRASLRMSETQLHIKEKGTKTKQT
jgi:hypothetical protein